MELVRLLITSLAHAYRVLTCTRIIHPPEYCRRSPTLTVKMAEPATSTNPANSTKRLNFNKQSLDDAYAVPANQLEIEVVDPQPHFEGGKKKYVDYLVNFKVSLIYASV